MSSQIFTVSRVLVVICLTNGLQTNNSCSLRRLRYLVWIRYTPKIYLWENDATLKYDVKMKNAYYIWIIFASHIFGFMCSGELFCVVFLYKGWWKDNGKQNIRSTLRVYNEPITVRKRSCGKVMFLHPLGRHPPGQTHPLGRHPPAGKHHPGRSPLPHPTPTRWPLQRTVRILLDCILVLWFVITFFR